MIKRLLTTALVLGGLAAGAQNKVEPRMSTVENRKFEASTNQSFNKNSTVVVTDTTWYFYNKNIWKFNNSFFTVKTPMSFSVQVNTEFGVSFLNPDNASITISKAAILASRMATSPSTAIPITITLYTASPSGVPGASVATATCVITGTGGNVSSIATFSSPIVATGAYFLAYKNSSPNPLDTVNVFLTSAYTATSGAAANLKFGENLAYIRNNGNMIPTENYYNTGTPGSNLEPLLVPFVSFNYSASATQSAPNATAVPGAYCANLGISYTNTSSGIVNNRQYNYNQFGTTWAPKTSTVVMPTADPVHNWSFSGPPTPTATYSTANVTHTYATTGNASANLIVKYQNGSGSGAKTQEVKTWTLQIANCGIVGVNENQLNANMNVYPNPAINGKVNISGLEGTNTVAVYNMIGQLVSTETTNAEVVTVDLKGRTAGTYVIRVTDSTNHSKVVKVINE